MSYPKLTLPKRSIIPAMDVKTITDFLALARALGDLPQIGAYKVGFSLGLRYGLPEVVKRLRYLEAEMGVPSKPVIYDHQKAGGDIPDTGEDFASVCVEAGVSHVILFPHSGPETEEVWIKKAQAVGLVVIVGGRMTHKAYTVSEGGFITDEGAMEMYRVAARLGVTNFVVPGNKPEVVAAIKTEIEKLEVTPVFFSPGFVAQGGVISEAAKVAGESWHAIAGRVFTKSTDPRKAALEYASQLG